MLWNFASQTFNWFENYSHVCLSQLTMACVIAGGGGENRSFNSTRSSSIKKLIYFLRLNTH